MKLTWSTAVVVAAVSAAVSAQSGKEMNEPKMGGKMTMTYTGCIEAMNHGGSFLLTQVGDDHEAMMGHDGMTKGDSQMAQKDEPRPSNEMHDDHMMSSAIILIGRSDLKKHVGQKVTVTGSRLHTMSATVPNDRDTVAVTSLKVVAKSCS
jgi:hypothetical protein